MNQCPTRMIFAGLGLLALPWISQLPAQEGLLEGFSKPKAAGKGHVTWTIAVEPAEAKPGDRVEVVAKYETVEGWHIYAPDHKATGIPTSLAAASPAVKAAGALKYPKPTVKSDPILGETQSLLEGKGELRLPLEVAADAPAGEAAITVKLGYMSCDARGCDPPSKKEEKVVLKVIGGSQVAAAAPAKTAPATPGVVLKKEHVTWMLSVDPASVKRGGRVEVVAGYDVPKGFHIYSPDHKSAEQIGVPTKVSVDSPGLKADGAPKFPKPVEKKNELTFGETHRFLEGKGEVRQGFLVATDAKPGELTFKVKLEGQVCSETQCFEAGGEAEVRVTVLEGEAAPAPAPEKAAPGKEAAPEKPADGAQGNAAPVGGAQPPPPAGRGAPKAPWAEGLLGFVLSMIGGALFALAMPCTYPMIPITISFFTKQADARQGSLLPLALAYGAGIVLIFVVIGTVFAAAIIPFAADPWVNLVFGVAFVVFALSLFGIYELRLPSGVNAFAGKATGGTGYIGVFLLGTVLVVTSFTCTAPVLGLVLQAAIQGGNMGKVAFGMAVFGVTMAAPFVILAMFPARVRSLPRAGEWMHTLKVFLGFIELAAALKFVSNSDLVWNHPNVWITREAFLLFCGVDVFVAGLYLLGTFRLKDEEPRGISGTRMLGGLATLLVAFYLFFGLLGFGLNPLLEALAPMQRAPMLGAQPWTLVEDDWEGGLRKARDEGKRAFVNFTGVTCVNCRLMEGGVFTKPPVTAVLRKYVEVRLHTDKDTPEAKRFQALKQRLTESEANPIYVIVDPAEPDKVLDRYFGADPSGGAEFRQFLEANVQ